jgi:GAF domain-containing protein
MTESEVLFEISKIVNGPLSFSYALEQISLLLEQEAGGKGVFADSPDAAKLLDAFDHPYRSFYNVEMRAGDAVLGTVTLCFASHRLQRAFEQRVANFVGQQLGMLLTRATLAERRVQLRGEIARMKKDLAIRKLMQRAEGVLIAQRGMEPSAAKRWIAQQSNKTSLSPSQVAERIIAYYQTRDLMDLKIA